MSSPRQNAIATLGVTCLAIVPSVELAPIPRTITTIGSFCWSMNDAGRSPLYGLAFRETDVELSPGGSVLSLVTVSDLGKTQSKRTLAIIPHGWSCEVQRIGDLDGDGIADLAFSSNGTFVVSAASCDVIADLPLYSRVIAVIPDRDGDGQRDLLATVYENGHFRRVELTSSESRWHAIETGTPYGGDLLPLSDVDNDGFEEVLRFPRRGMPIVYSIAKDQAIATLSDQSRTLQGSIIESTSISAYTPVDRLLVVSYRHGAERSKVMAFSLSSGEVLWDRASALYESTDFCRDCFGLDLAGAGDINGDGVEDLLVGAPSFDPCSSSLQMLSGKTGETLWIQTTSRDERFGHCVSRIPDADGDDIDDYVVGIVSSDKAHGGVWIMSGRGGKRIRNVLSR